MYLLLNLLSIDYQPHLEGCENAELAARVIVEVERVILSTRKTYKFSPGETCSTHLVLLLRLRLDIATAPGSRRGRAAPCAPARCSAAPRAPRGG